MRYGFGDCLFDTQLCVLQRAGQTYMLRPKVFEVLHYLLQHRDRILSKQELVAQLWPEEFISDAALEAVIKAIRRVVGDDGRTQWCIQTRRGQGYRFVAPLVDTTAQEVVLPAEPCDTASSAILPLTPVLDQPGHEDTAESLEPALAVLPPQEPSTTPPDTPPSRRQLTILACALVDATALASQLDPEELREVVLAYHSVCREVIQRFDGYLAHYLDDGLVLYFGYPQAHEDDAQRAVRAGLALLEALGPLQTRVERDYRVRLAVRLGIHTGLVVVGALGDPTRQDPVALGATPTIAARLQAFAAPNRLVISSATRRLLGSGFALEDLGVHVVDGGAAPMRLYGVGEEQPEASRFDAATAPRLTPLVGREEELWLLLRRWEQAQDGEGQVVLLTGEAGIGKSRLMQAVCERIAEEPHSRVLYQCVPYYRNSAFHPIMVQLAQAAQFRRDDTPAQQLVKLERLLAQGPEPAAHVLSLFAALLSLPTAPRYPPLQLSPQRQKALTIEAVVTQLLGRAQHQPMVCLFEDAHWSDPTSLEVLDLLVQRVQEARVLLVITSRHALDTAWTAASHVTALMLNRLSRAQVEAMVEHLTVDTAFPGELLGQILARADGVPLFVEELTRTILESDLLPTASTHAELPRPVPPLAIPATLHDALMARLDRLGPVKEVAQIGAIIGREFSYELLAAVAGWRATDLEVALDHLVHATLLFRQGQPPEATYRFKHALVQETAYASLLRCTRQQLHARIAAVLEARFPGTAETEPEVLAHHWTEAGCVAQALPYWQRAGQRAAERSAHREAIGHVTQGLKLLESLPDTPERAQHALTFYTILGRSFMLTTGYATPEVEHAYTRARDLCHQVGDTPQLLPVLFGLCNFHVYRAELQTARALGDQLLRLATRAHDLPYVMLAHGALGFICFCRGAFARAHHHLAQRIARYDPQHGTPSLHYGADPKVVGLAWSSWTLWMLGYPTQALARMQEALDWAHELVHPLSLAFATAYAAVLHQCRQEAQATQEWAEAAIRVATEHGSTQWLTIGTILRGWALAVQGHAEQGMVHMRQGLRRYRETGAELGRPYFLLLLAEACGRSDRVDEGLRLLNEAVLRSEKNHDRFCTAELLRLKGTLLLRQSGNHAGEAATYFQQALSVARQQQAKSWELRAATSLARLWQSQGKCQEASDLLAPVYAWFTEGFDTADVQEAKVLLEELGG